MTIPELLAQNVKKRRTEYGWSQSLLAEQVNVSLSTIAALETCQKFPSPSTLQDLAKALGLKPYELFLDEADVEPDEGRKALREFAGSLQKELPAQIKTLILEKLNDYL